MTLRFAGIHTIVVSVGRGLDQGRNGLMMRGLASEPFAENMFNVEYFRQLYTLVEPVSYSLCNGKRALHPHRTRVLLPV